MREITGFQRGGGGCSVMNNDPPWSPCCSSEQPLLDIVDSHKYLSEVLDNNLELTENREHMEHMF